MLTEYAIQQLPTPFTLDICGFEPVLSSWEVWGNFSVALNLQPVDNKATNYQIETVFYADDALNLTLTDTTPNGTAYAVCTTLQYFDFKPASNCAWLTIEPQSTQVMQQTKTQEEMQQ